VQNGELLTSVEEHKLKNYCVFVCVYKKLITAGSFYLTKSYYQRTDRSGLFGEKNQNHKIAGSGYLKNRNQRTIGSGYFKNLKEPPSFMKEPTVF
jgi:hypothetical protein